MQDWFKLWVYIFRIYCLITSRFVVEEYGLGACNVSLIHLLPILIDHEGAKCNPSQAIASFAPHPHYFHAKLSPRLRPGRVLLSLLLVFHASQ
jgi:hypothetical protein